MLKSKIDKATGFEKRFENINTVVFENSNGVMLRLTAEVLRNLLENVDLSQIKLVNNAQACHVYWAVGSSATLGNQTKFVGTLI